MRASSPKSTAGSASGDPMRRRCSISSTTVKTGTRWPASALSMFQFEYVRHPCPT
jgi:hypothetical protein